MHVALGRQRDRPARHRPACRRSRRSHATRRWSIRTSRSRTGPSSPASHLSSPARASRRSPSNGRVARIERTRAPGRDAVAVEILRVVTKADTGVVALELPQLLLEERAKLVEGGDSGPSAGRGRKLDQPHDLRPAVRFLRARPTQLARQALQVVLVPVDELDLELDERAGRAPAVQHVDRVDRDVRERRARRPRPGRRVRRVLSVATCSSFPWRSCAKSSAASSAGGPAGPPRASISARASPERGSFSCQRERPFSSRRRSVIPTRASERAGVS